jgi:hypothetical protein
MKVIDAYWEKRNLGVSCTEITIDLNDTLEKIEIELNKCDSEYIVCKVEGNKFDVNSLLSENGFKFIESSINVVLDVKSAKLSSIQDRINKEINYELMNTEDIEVLNNEIKNGLFKTDRIILDNQFSQEQASNRYFNWIKDELIKETKIFKIIFKSNVIGFFTFKQNGDLTYYPFLAGLYEKYKNSGLGFASLRKPIEEVIRLGGGTISTYVSSNNLPVINLHIQFGFTMRKIEYVFIKHKKKIK